MGFWSWLFGFGKKNEPEVEIGEIQQPDIDINIRKEEKNDILRKPMYKPRPITKEDIAFVQEMSNKAKTPDPKITPFIDRTDPKQIEKITNDLKDKLARRR